MLLPVSSRLRRHCVPVALILLASALLPFGARSAERVLLDDSLTDLNRFDQAIPASAAWRYAGEGVGEERLNLAPPLLERTLQLNSLGSAFVMSTYFTAAGAPRTLAVGDSLEMTMQVTLSATPDAPTGLRIGLYDSKGSRPAADAAASSVVDPATYGVYSGYGIYFNPVGATSNLSGFNLVRKTTADNFGVPQITSGPILNLGSNTLPALGIGPNVPFPVSLRVRRLSETSVEIRASVNGVVATATDSTGAFTTAFDTLSLFGTSAALPNNQTLKIDEVAVAYTPGAATPQVLLNDAFTDGSRTNQAPPHSSAWFIRVQNVNATPASMLSVPTVSTPNPNRDLVYRAGTVPASALAYFSDGIPQALADGEALVLRLSLRTTLPVNVARGLRIALLNSQGNRMSSDLDTTQVNPGELFTGYQGYSIDLNTSDATAGSLVAARRTAGSPDLFGSEAWTPLGTGSFGSSGIVSGPWARVSLRLLRLGATLRVEAMVDETWIVVSDSSPATFAFDTIAVHMGPGVGAGGTVRIDDVLVVHSTGLMDNLSSPSTILSENFNSGAWPQAAFVGSAESGALTGTVSHGDVGSYDGLGSLVRSGGLRLAAHRASASGPCTATLRSGPLAASNAQTDLAFLTLAFDARASTPRPFRVAVESLDPSGASTGRLERWVYPHAADYLQRYSFELSDMSAVSGTFDPTAASWQLSFTVEGGSIPTFDWGTAALTLDIDNVHLARPRYVVSPTGNNSNPGTVDAPFATLARANALVMPGDIVLVRSGTAAFPDYQVSTDTNNQGIQLTRGGRPAAWVTYKNYPGERPTLRNVGWAVVRIGSGFASSRDRISDVAYVELRGMEFHGIADSLAESIKGSSSNGSSNTNGVSIEGRFMALRPHHLRLVDLTARNLSGGGLGGLQTDYVAIEGNLVRDTSSWTAYATSGLGFLQPFDYSGLPNEWRLVIAQNTAIRNQTLRPWVAIGALSDGNGIIVDNFYNTQGNSTEGAYSGRTLVQGNLLTLNGGSGAHTFTSRRVTFANNTSYHNNQVLNYGELWSNQSDDVVFTNNILVSAPTTSGTPRQLNPVVSNSSFPIVQGVQFIDNIYQVGAGSQAPTIRPGDTNNLLTAALLFADPAAGDFRLRPGSPAIDHGQVSAGTSLQDLLGYPRATDGLIDAGAIERQPMILRQPQSQTVPHQGSVALTVLALGDSVTYQWQKDGVDLAGAVGPNLTIADATAADSGSYRVVVSTDLDTLTSASATVVVLTPIQSWRQLYFGTTEGTGATADAADFSGDGLPNLLAYALGLDPTENHGTAGPVASTLNLNGDEYLTLRFTRDPSASDVALTVQASGDLANWTDLDPFGPNQVSLTDQGSRQEIVVRDVLPLGSGGRFLRLKVTALPLTPSASVDAVYSTPVGGFKTALPVGAHALAFPLKNPTEAVGRISGNTATTVSFENVIPSLQAGRAYFLEIETGPFEGERLDLDVAATLAAPAGTVVLQGGNSSASTLPAPPADVLAGSRASLRRHLTLGDLPALFTSGLNGHLDVAQADGVQLHVEGALRTYVLRPDGTWREAAGSVDETGRILSPDTSLLVQLRSGPKAWKLVGQVRTHAFRLRLPVGERAIATGFPVPMSPVQFGAYVDASAPAGAAWTGSHAPGQADWLRIFDATSAAFRPHVLRADGRTWNRLGSTTDLAHSPLLAPIGMVIVRRQQADGDYLVVPPFDL